MLTSKEVHKKVKSILELDKVLTLTRNKNKCLEARVQIALKNYLINTNYK